ncbi:MAG: pro-sigmaK processing inhibitor BofA family protein [Candidatus Paceibacterota bacterium]|jgi:hypothetical protein
MESGRIKSGVSRIAKNESANRVANATPFVGGAKRMAESAAGKTLAGEKLSGRDRWKHGAGGAADLALDFTGIGEVEKGAKMAYIGKKIASGLEENTKKEATREIKDQVIKRGIAADNYRIKSQAGRNEEAQRIKSEAQREAERHMNHEFQKSARMSGVKGRVASKIASRGVSEAAYQIASRLSEKAKQGGHWAVIVFIVTLLIAIIVDALDIVGTLLIETILGWLIIFLINTLLSLIINIFWMLLAGGGHSKFFWKILVRYIIFGLILDSIPIIELFPFTVFMVCWNWYDYSKERSEAKQELKRFSKVYAKTGEIKGQSMKYA